MNKLHFSFPVPTFDWIRTLSYWATQNYPYVAYFSGNNHPYPAGNFGQMLFAGNTLLNPNETWKTGAKTKVGIIGYDFKNKLESLQSLNEPILDLPETCFFEAELIIRLEDGQLWSNQKLSSEFWEELAKTPIPPNPPIRCDWSPQITKEQYIQSVQKIQNQILEGETYEMNFCQAYVGEYEEWDPIAAYFRLNEISPMPFSAFFKAQERWIVSASPERFIKKTENKIITQPIKGTIRRGRNEAEDAEYKLQLATSEKERAENLMITDLMRNDLSKVSETGSVQVDELFGIYPMPKVFQMISTVSAVLKPETSLEQIIAATFPMGSMTGAPKIRTMNLIDELEKFQRGWFSGALGWVDEAGDFDFSVVIRSIITDLTAKKLYFGVGSAITFDADPEQEYQECQLKAQAIVELLRGT
jgi:para-aminobenzoate synthetase component 1